MTKKLEGRLLENPVLLIAPRKFIFPDETREEAYQEALERFTQRYDLLKGSGCDVKVLCAKEDTKYSHKYWRLTSDFEKLRPNSLMRLDVNSKKNYLATIWPRDVFQVFGDFVISTPDYEENTKEVLSRLGVKEFNIISSDLGQGGYIVRDRNLLVLSSKFVNDPNIDALKSRGYEIEYLPVPSKEDNSDLGKRMHLNSHIDTEFNLVFSPAGNPLMLVTSEYYASFKKQVDKLVKRKGGKLHVIPEGYYYESGKAVNFITLPNGKVMFPNCCHETQEFLEYGLGKDNVLIGKVGSTDFSSPDGGLRCMSNLIE